MQLIVNADDLGRNKLVTDAICSLVDAGLVTSTTIMANAPGFEHAISMIQRCRRCSIGVHLNLTEFAPLTGAPGLKPLLDAAGNFTKCSKWFILSPRLLESVYHEWQAQIQAVICAGITPSHLDSHHHIHLLPQFYPLIRRCQLDFKIRRVRRSKNLYAPVQLYTRGVLVWRVISHAALSVLTQSTVTDWFTDLPTFLRVHRRIKNIQTVEIMVHPGHPLFAEDERTLRSESWRQLTAEHDLIGYTELM